MSVELARDLGFARVEPRPRQTLRSPRSDFFQGKLPAEVSGIALALRERGQPVLATRAEASHFEAVRRQLPDVVFHERARCITDGGLPGRCRILACGRDLRGNGGSARC